MEQASIFCTECGAANPLIAETCSQCQAELIPPHPIELDGGEIYSLKCEKCQARVMVTDVEGFVRCDECDTYHKIEKGDGYLTIHAVSKMNAKDAESVLAAEDCKPVLLSTLDERLKETQMNTQNRDALVRRFEEIGASIQRVYNESKKARASRNTGIVQMFVGLIAFLTTIGLTVSHSDGSGGMVTVLGFLSFLVMLVGILVATLSYTRKKRDKLDGLIATLTAEAARIQKDLNNLGPKAGGR
jgi:hypothetical protein